MEVSYSPTYLSSPFSLRMRGSAGMVILLRASMWNNESSMAYETLGNSEM